MHRHMALHTNTCMCILALWNQCAHSLCETSVLTYFSNTNMCINKCLNTGCFLSELYTIIVGALLKTCSCTRHMHTHTQPHSSLLHIHIQTMRRNSIQEQKHKDVAKTLTSCSRGNGSLAANSSRMALRKPWSTFRFISWINTLKYLSHRWWCNTVTCLCLLHPCQTSFHSLSFSV